MEPPQRLRTLRLYVADSADGGDPTSCNRNIADCRTIVIDDGRTAQNEIVRFGHQSVSAPHLRLAAGIPDAYLSAA
jgi:hypothetical protein